MRKFKLLIVASILCFFASSAYAQDYKTAAGIRLGYKNGITVKHFIDDRRAVEGLLTTWQRGFLLTGLYEFHQPAFDVAGLNWHYGGGAHIWTWQFGDPLDGIGGSTAVGLDAIGGLEYTFSEAPVNLALNYKPGLNLTPSIYFFSSDINLSVRYILK